MLNLSIVEVSKTPERKNKANYYAAILLTFFSGNSKASKTFLWFELIIRDP